MNSTWFKKGLVVGIIVLCIGIGFKPALSDEVTIPTISNSEDDCNCNIPNGKLHLAEKIVNKAENYLESKDLIIFDGPPYDRPICNMLFSIAMFYGNIALKYINLAENTSKDSTLYLIYLMTAFQFLALVVIIEEFGAVIDCWDTWPPYY